MKYLYKQVLANDMVKLKNLKSEAATIKFQFNMHCIRIYSINYNVILFINIVFKAIIYERINLGKFKLKIEYF